MDYEQARATLHAHRPRPWFWWALGRLAYCVACGGRWTCQPVRDARAYIDRIDPPQLPGETEPTARVAEYRAWVDNAPRRPVSGLYEQEPPNRRGPGYWRA